MSILIWIVVIIALSVEQKFTFMNSYLPNQIVGEKKMHLCLSL